MLPEQRGADVAFTRTLGEAGVSSPPATASREGLVQRLREALAASAWSAVVGKAFVVMLGLLVLAWIGRAATAAPAGRLATAASIIGSDAGSETVAPADAQLAPLPASVASPSPSPFPSPSTPPSSPASAATPAPAPLPTPSSPPPSPARSPSRATTDDPVYVNYASAEELRRLPGVGPKRAEAILALRQRMGRFQRVEDLLRVKGVGRATLRKWRPLVRLDAPARPDTPVSGDAGAPPPPS